MKCNGTYVKKEMLMLGIMFIIASIMYFFLSFFCKSVFILNDEMYYLEAARAIAHGKGMMYNGINSPFQKVLYSFLISPAFLFDNHEVQMILVSLINAICTASSVFPSYLLAKEAGLVKQKRYALCFFALVFPETLNCMGFMSEVLFYPLWIWVMYLVYRSIKNEGVSIKHGILLGIVAYMLYMTKEVGIIALPAYIGMELLYFVRRKVSYRRIVQCGISFAAFAACFILAKLLLFSQTTGGSYNIVADGYVFNLWTIPFLMYVFIYYLVYVIFSMFVFPVFFAPMKEERNREFYFYTCGCIVSLIIVIVLLISLKEDFLVASPRLHIRYIAPLTIPFVMFILLDENVNDKTTGEKKSIAEKMLIVYVVVLAIIPPINTHGLLDSKGLEVFRVIGIASERIFGEKIGSVLYFIGLKTICIFLVLYGFYLYKKKKTSYKKALVISVLCICICSAIIKIYEIRSLYSIDKQDRKQAIEADEKLDELDGRKLWLLREVTDPFARLVITYHDNRESDLSYVGDTITEEVELMAGGAIKKAKISDYSYICIDKQLIEQNKTILGEYSNEVVWSSDLFEIRRVKYE